MTTALEKNQTRKMRPALPFWNSPLDRFFRNDFTDLWEGDITPTIPSINVTEEKNSFIVNMAAPGLKKEDFDISLEGDLLTISCEKETEKDGKENANFTRREYNYSFFSRTVTLPETAESKDIVAKYTDGILNLTIPKKPESEKNNSKKIKVQ
jgi:HSP20 family protein